MGTKKYQKKFIISIIIETKTNKYGYSSCLLLFFLQQQTQRRLSTTKTATAPIVIPTTTLVNKDGESDSYDDDDLGEGRELWLRFDGVDGVFERDRCSRELDGVDVVVDGVDGGGGEVDESEEVQ